MKKVLFAVIFVLCFTSFVYADDEDFEQLSEFEIWEDIRQTSAKESNLPNVNSRAAVVIDRNSKAILFGKNENDKRPMASTTKIMTAIVCLENGNLNKEIEVSPKAAGIGGSCLGLKKGDKLTLNDLLYGLLLRSRK